MAICGLGAKIAAGTKSRMRTALSSAQIRALSTTQIAALETADVVLAPADLRNLPFLIQHARRAARISAQGEALFFTVKTGAELKRSSLPLPAGTQVTSLQQGQPGVMQAGTLDELLQQPPPSQVWLSSVAASTQLAALQQAWPASVFHVTRSEVAAGGVINGYREPQRLGVDRWLALLAARQLCRAPQMVVDAGTALTIDLLDEFGQHKGGWIMPGLQLLRQALIGGTAAVRPQGADGGGGFGRDTTAAVSGGCQQMLVAAVLRAQEQAQRDLNSRLSPRLLLTGGDGALLAGLLAQPSRLVPDLVLRGLAYYALRDISSGNKSE